MPPFRNPQSAIRNLLLSSLLILPACSHTNTTSDSVYKDSAPTANASASDQHWIPLFNGHDTTGWHLYHAQGQPVTNWQAVDGTLKCVTKGHDLISDASYANFILDLDYKLEPHVNSGIVYRCDESEAKAWQTGVEYQLIDNENKDPLEPHMNAAAYALYGCTTDANHPAGQWNHARIVCDGTHVTHYLNGTKVVEYDTASPDFQQREAASKFHVYKNFAKLPAGHISFQGDHSNNVSFRNIQLLPLPDKSK